MTSKTSPEENTRRRNKLLTAGALAFILALGAFLRFYQLGAYSIGNTYYAATVKSMLTSWSNFFFGAFEPGGSVTVDKPPLGFWVQALSAALLGVNGFALALPNALAGLGSIALVYHLVKAQFNTAAGLIAALTLAVVPVTIATERNNTIDGLLAFVLLLAVWAFWKAVEGGKFCYLLLGALIVGLGFNIKMLQAYMILPAVFGLYFFGARHGWWTRLWQLGVATLVMLVISLSWAVAVDLIPPENRPFIGSSQDNSVLELIIGHNGLMRLGLGGVVRRLGDDGGPPRFAGAPQPGQDDGSMWPDQNRPPDPPPRVPGDGPPPPPGDGGAPPTGGRPGNEIGQAGLTRLFSEPLVIEASWFLPLALLSIPLTAAGVIVSRGAAENTRKQWLELLLWTAWLLPVAAYFSFTTGLFHRYYLIMLGPPLAALMGMAFWAFGRLFEHNFRLGMVVLTLSVTVALGFQVWMVDGYAPSSWLRPLMVLLLSGLGLLLFKHTPRVRLAAFGLILAALLVAPSTWSFLVATDTSPDVALPTASLDDTQRTTFMTPNNALLTENETAILNYLLANTDPKSYLLATVNARSAAPYILATGRAVLTFGGFSGSDPIIDADGVAEMVARGELRYILYSEQIANAHPDIATWVTQACTPVNVPGVRTPREQNRPMGQVPSARPALQADVLYDCAQ